MWVSWSLSDIYCLFPFFIPFRFFLLYCLFTPIDFYKQSCSIKLEMESYNLYIYCNFFHLSFLILWKGKEEQKPKRKQKRKLWNFWENKVEAEAEAVPKIWKRKRKRFWKIKLKWKQKRKRIFFEKNFGSGSGSEFFLKKKSEAEAEALSKSTASKTLAAREQAGERVAQYLHLDFKTFWITVFS